MKTLLAMAAGMVSQLAAGVSVAQNANMMNGGSAGGGWMGGYGGMAGYGGIWGPVLLVVVVVGLVAWIVTQKRK
jgi:hypothetical protein